MEDESEQFLGVFRPRRELNPSSSSQAPAEKFSLKHLENRHCKRRSGLTGRCISPVGKRRGGPAGLRGMRYMGLQTEGRWRAQMSSNSFLQRGSRQWWWELLLSRDSPGPNRGRATSWWARHELPARTGRVVDERTVDGFPAGTTRPKGHGWALPEPTTRGPSPPLPLNSVSRWARCPDELGVRSRPHRLRRGKGFRLLAGAFPLFCIRRCQWHGVVGGDVLNEDVLLGCAKRDQAARSQRGALVFLCEAQTGGRWEGGARGRWADMTAIKPAEKDPLLRCFFLLEEKGNGRAERNGSMSHQKAQPLHGHCPDRRRTHCARHSRGVTFATTCAVLF